MGSADEPRLRGVLKDDLRAIADLEAFAFGSYGLDRTALDVLFDPSGGLWLLAEDDEGVWGYAVNARGEDPHVGWILGMAVRSERQGRGWGRLLLQASIERLRDSDVTVVRLLVDPRNTIAHKLYAGFGFLDTGERVDHFGAGADRLVMSLLLPPAPVRPTAVTVSSVPQVPVDDDQNWFS